MNYDNINQHFTSRNFVRDIQEACNLCLDDCRDARDYIQLMKMYLEVTQ